MILQILPICYIIDNGISSGDGRGWEGIIVDLVCRHHIIVIEPERLIINRKGTVDWVWVSCIHLSLTSLMFY